MNQYQIKLTYSQLTLKPLTEPYYHVESGCQFDQSDIKQKFESAKMLCPICKRMGTLKQDLNLKIALLEKTDKQLIQHNGQIKQLCKTSYSHSIKSQHSDINNLLINFNSQINKSDLSMNFIEKLNQERNREYFQIIKRLSQTELSQELTLVGVICHRLIIIFNKYRIKLELDLCEAREEKLIKMNTLNPGSITQVEFFKNRILLIVQNQQLYQLYSGDLNQISDPDFLQTLFIVQQQPGYTMKNFAKLVCIQDNMMMIGSDGMIELDFINYSAFLNTDCAIQGLDKNSFITTYKGNIIIVNSETKKLEEGRFLGHCFDVRLGLRLSSLEKFDGAIVYANKTLLLNSDNLQFTKITVQCIISGSLNSTKQEIPILNHSSYMKMIFIPSTAFQMGEIVCYMIGLLIPSEHKTQDIILPGILVYYNKSTSLSIELL